MQTPTSLLSVLIDVLIDAFDASVDRYGEQKIAQFRTHYLTKERACVSTQ